MTTTANHWFLRLLRGVDMTRRLPPSAVQVLGAVWDLCREGDTTTVRAIADRLGWPIGNGVWANLRRLRDMRLVSYRDRKGGTIRPTCRFEPVA